MTMSNNCFNILSIDFDFFPDVSTDQLSLYPDPVDLPTNLSEITWSTRNERVKDIRINKKFYNEVCEILTNQNKNIPVLFANSHVQTYYFIIENANNKKIKITNVDFHHDIENENKKVDCGNWIGRLHKRYPETQAIWIARKNSVEAYEMTDKEIKLFNMQFDFSKIKNKKFDAVSIARSDNWVPPHLDTYFDNLLKICNNYFNEIKVEESVLKPRHIYTINDLIKK